METNRKSKRWNWLPWAIGAVVLGVGGLALRRNASSGTGIPSGVVTAKAEVGTQRQQISASGVVASQIGTQVKIGSQITGRIVKLPADVGSRVNANQIIAVLDAPDLQAQVEQQRQNLQAQQASLAQAESRYQQALEASAFTGAQTVAQIDEAAAALRASRAKVDSAAAAARLQPTQTASDIERAQASLSTAKSALLQEEQTIRQQILQAQSNLDDAQIGVDNAKRTLQRQQELLKKGYVAHETVDALESTYKQTVAKLENMKASLDITREKTRADLQAVHDQVAQAEAGLRAAQAERLQDALHLADLRSAQEALRQSQATLALQKANHSQDVLKRMAIHEAQNAVQQYSAAVRQAQAQLAYQQAQLDKAIIRSPIAGTVLSITAQQGETVAAGLSAPTLITVADLNRLEVRAYVDETDIGHVRLGLPAEVRVEAFTDRVFKGTVTKIASASTIKDNVVTYEVTIALANPAGLLRPDMTTDVSLILGEHPNVLLVPSEALHTETTRSFVYVLHADKQGADRVELRPVKPGFDDGAKTEIRSGLKSGETVVLAGLPLLGVRAPDAQGGGR